MKVGRWVWMVAIILTAFSLQKTVTSSASLQVIFDRDEGTLTVIGSIADQVGEPVGIVILDPAGNIEYVRQVKSGTDGSFHLSYKMPEMLTGYYEIKMNSHVTGTQQSVRTYVSSTQQSIAGGGGRSTQATQQSTEMNTPKMLATLATFVSTQVQAIESERELMEVHRRLQQMNRAVVGATLLLERIKEWNTPVIRSLKQLLHETNEVILIAKERNGATVETMQLEQAVLTLAETMMEQAGLYTVTYISPEQSTPSKVTLPIDVGDMIGKSEWLNALYGFLKSGEKPSPLFNNVRKRIGVYVPSSVIDVKQQLQVEWSADLLTGWQRQGIQDLSIHLDDLRITFPLDSVERELNEGLAILVSQDYPVIEVSVLVLRPDGHLRPVMKYKQPIQVSISNALFPGDRHKPIAIMRLHEIQGKTISIHEGALRNEDTGTWSWATTYPGTFIVQNVESSYAEFVEIPWAEEAIVSLFSRGTIKKEEAFISLQEPVSVHLAMDWFETTLRLGDMEWNRHFGRNKLALLSALVADHDAITRQDLAVLAAYALVAMNIPLVEITEVSAHFTDRMEIDDHAQRFVASTVKYRLMNGYPENTFVPQQLATRAETVMVIDRLWKLQWLVRR